MKVKQKTKCLKVDTTLRGSKADVDSIVGVLDLLHNGRYVIVPLPEGQSIKKARVVLVKNAKSSSKATSKEKA